MQRIVLAVAAIALAEAPALACSCALPPDREVAAGIASDALAVVEVVQVEPLQMARMRGELYRVVRVHVGDPPETFRLARNFHRHSSGLVTVPLYESCAVVPPPGEVTLIALHAPRTGSGEEGKESTGDCKGSATDAGATEPTLSLSNMCEYLVLQKNGTLAMIVEEARRIGRR